MKVHLIKRKAIQDYFEAHPGAQTSFENWLTGLKYADWRIPGDSKQTFGSADLLGSGSNRVVFDIGGNKYRMICKYHFGFTKVHLFICWIGTHTKYVELCDRGEQFTVNAY